MIEQYFITGATGFLGSTLTKALVDRGKKVVGLRLPQDQSKLLSGVEYRTGDITEPDTLEDFLAGADGQSAVLIHCAGLVSIGSGQEERVRKVNVEGTKNLVDLAMRNNIGRFIYVSSVHAIREQPDGMVIRETLHFSPDEIIGSYGKSKAEATAYVLNASMHGLNATVVHPSGMIGPGDLTGGYMTETIRAFLKGGFPVAIEGGYDFADVRDVAEGIIQCVEHGKSGETYILSNRYITVKEIFECLSAFKGIPRAYKAIPLKPLILFAPLLEWAAKKLGLPKLLTPYSLYTLGSNGHFSHEKADRELGYSVRPLEQTLIDTAKWLVNGTP